MKYFILGLMAFAASSVFACEQYEAQFSAKIKSVTMVQSSSDLASCKLEIDQIEYFSGNYFCPLFVETVKTQGIDVRGKGCQAKAGDAISGVLIDDGKTITIE